MHGAKKINNTYVHLAYYLTPKRYDLPSIKTEPKKIEIDSYINTTDTNTIILGQPGSGKTTSMKYISNLFTNSQHELLNKFNHLVVIRYRELSDHGIFYTLTNQKDLKFQHKNYLSQGIFDELLKVFGIFSKEIYYGYKWYIQNLITLILNKLKVLLILDGFDEYPHDKKEALSDIKYLTRNLTDSKFILSSRPAEFTYNINNTKIFEIAPLNNTQIKRFSIQWLKNDSEKSKLFIKLLQESSYLEIVRRPLLLTFLIIIFENNKPHNIPKQPYEIYKEIIELFVKEWDSERGITRKSKYFHFQTEKKKMFLCKFSFYLTVIHQTNIFSTSDVKKVYQMIADSFHLPLDEYDTIINEIESHNGLFLKTGSDSYEFLHKSIQEYLNAMYLQSLPSISKDYLSIDISKKEISLLNFPNESAILIAISSEPSKYFLDIINRAMEENYNYNFFMSFLQRLDIENPTFTNGSELCYTILKLNTRILEEIKNSSDNREQYLVVKKQLERLNLIDDESMALVFRKLNKHYKFDRTKIIQETLLQISKNNVLYTPESLIELILVKPTSLYTETKLHIKLKFLTHIDDVHSAPIFRHITSRHEQYLDTTRKLLWINK